MLRPRALTALWLALFCALAGAGQAGELRLVVLHTNDLHGQCRVAQAGWLDREDPPLAGGLPRVAAYVASVRAELDGPREGLLVLDGGDWFQGTPEGLLDSGEAFTRALVAVGYDALVVGNHEFDHGIDHLVGLIERTGVPCVLANVRAEEGGPRVPWAPPNRIFERAGLRVGVVGLLTPDTRRITHADARELWFDDPLEALTDARAELADERLDLLIPLTHLGVRSDIELARAHPDLPLILGGHSHTLLPVGELVGGCLVCQVGAKGVAVGRAELVFDADTRELVRRSYRVVPLTEDPSGPRNEAVDAAVNAMLARSEERMAECIGALSTAAVRARSRLASSSAGNLITDLMRARTGAQVAIQNRGGIRADLSAGPVTRRDAFELLPFGNHLVVLELSGERLADVLRRAIGTHDHRGIEFSGMRVDVRPKDEGLGELLSITVGGTPLEPEARVTVVTNDFLAGGGDGYFGDDAPPALRADPILLRELLEHGMRRAGGELAPTEENRYVVNGER